MKKNSTTDAANREGITDNEIARILGDTAVTSDCLSTPVGRLGGDGYCKYVARSSYPKSLFRRWRFQINVKSVFLITTSASAICALLKRYGPPNPSEHQAAYCIFIAALAIPCAYIGKDVYRNRFVGMAVGAAFGIVLSHVAIVVLWIRLIWW